MKSKEPTFHSVFLNKWDSLPEVIKKHYANRPFSHDVVTVKGKMNFIIAPWAEWIMPLFKWLNIIVPYAGENIDVTVHYKSDPNADTFALDRWIYFPNQKPYHFPSVMHHIKGNEVVEHFACGLCWRMQYDYDGEKVLLLHKGYALSLFGKTIPLPVSAIVGKGYAEEIALDDNRFKMKMTITHPLFGVYYEYNGVFSVSS